MTQPIKKQQQQQKNPKNRNQLIKINQSIFQPINQYTKTKRWITYGIIEIYENCKITCL